jgi:ABC-type branched-subunit amino acid transport system permease subunit
VLVVGLWFHEEHFIILMMTTALLLMVAALGLTIQFGYAGVVNFAGAAFLGIGCYTAGVVTKYTALPSFLTLPLGGLMAAIIGSILILPVLRTRGHYAALVTIAFGILFKVFLEVNDTLGGPQGIQVKPIVLFGWNFNSPIRIGDFTASFYFSYLLLALLLLVLSFALVRRLERSWIGLSLDAIRLDETASACYGLNLARWKVLAFTLGNFLAGTAGAAYGHVLGFIAPNNFTFGDSLILVSIILLGGLGNLWGVAVAAAFVVILPEKFQVIQEYRLVLYAALVILILLFRPEGTAAAANCATMCRAPSRSADVRMLRRACDERRAARLQGRDLPLRRPRCARPRGLRGERRRDRRPDRSERLGQDHAVQRDHRDLWRRRGCGHLRPART